MKSALLYLRKIDVGNVCKNCNYSHQIKLLKDKSKLEILSAIMYLLMLFVHMFNISKVCKITNKYTLLSNLIAVLYSGGGTNYDSVTCNINI